MVDTRRVDGAFTQVLSSTVNTPRVDGAFAQVLSSTVNTPRVDGAFAQVLSEALTDRQVSGVLVEVVTSESLPEVPGETGLKLAGEPLYLGRELGARLFRFGGL